MDRPPHSKLEHLGGCRQICTVNPEFIVDAYRDPVFAAALARADLRVPDGIGVLAAARLAGVRLQRTRHRLGRHLSHCRARGGLWLASLLPGCGAGCGRNHGRAPA